MSMALKYGMMKKAKAGGQPCDEHGEMNCMACGGDVGVNKPDRQMTTEDHNGTSEAGADVRRSKYLGADATGRAKAAHHETLSELKGMRGKDRKYLAEGGEVEDDDRDMELVDRIMKKRKGEPEADFEQNDFDVSDENPSEEFSYTGANSGDEAGNEAMDENDEDLIRRIMRSRAKKDKMPRPA